MIRYRLKDYQKLILGISAVFAVAVLTHVGALRNSYVLDDFKLVVGNRFITQWENIDLILSPRYFFDPQPIKCGARPLTVISLMTDYRLWGGHSSFGYHLTNLLLHGAAATAVFLLMLSVARRWRYSAAFVAALVFAVHPLQAEVVNIASFRADLLATLFYIAALALFIPAYESPGGVRSCLLYAGAVLSFLCSLFSKEIAVSLPAMLLFYMMFLSGRRLSRKNAMALIGFAAAGILFLILFWSARVAYLLHSTIFVNIAGNVSPLGSIAAYVNTLFMSFLHYLRTLVLPVDLSIDYLMTLPRTLLNGRMFLAIALAAAGTALFVRSRDRLLRFGLGFWAVSYLPVSNLIPLTNTVNDRYMYLPMVGFAAVLAAVFVVLHERARVRSVSIGVVGAVVVLAGYATLSAVRNPVFRDGVRLYGDAAVRVPGNVRVRYNLGVSLMARERYAEALREFGETVRNNPLYKRDDVWFLTGACHEEMGDFAAAKEFYGKSLLLTRKKYTVNRYANMIYREGRVEDATWIVANHVGLDPDPVLYNTLGTYYAGLGRYDRAIENFNRALELWPEYFEAWYNLLSAYNDAGMDSELVRREFRRMLGVFKLADIARREGRRY